MVQRDKSPVKAQKALADLNVNPCKMCMPMGVSTAAYGISRCVSILHGSQGCATYIRRHMATHYNEPVDIASSALTEQGTVYGGEESLHRGIDNLIRLYDPEVICIATTCLAETIGEDVPRMLDRWRRKNPDTGVFLVPVPSPGYGGTQFEGYFRFLCSLIKNVEMRPENAHHHQLNMVCGPMSPADLRFIKNLVSSFGIDAIFIPDTSESLDRGRTNTYDRTPSEGTPMDRVTSMAGSDLTIELASFLPKDHSPAELLEKQYGVPYKRLNLPIGLRDIDAFLNELSEFAGIPIPVVIRKERERYIDAMIDSHKYNAEGRAAIFGEPDFCYAVARMCVEEGIVPVVVASGSPCAGLLDSLEEEIGRIAKSFLVDRWAVMDDADFGDIERIALENGANILIGSSDGRRIAEKHNLPLIRSAFPIHDHVGGQRVRMMGYEGSLMLLDLITNALLQRKETGFRAAIRDEFYDNTLLANVSNHRASGSCEAFAETSTMLATMQPIEKPSAPVSLLAKKTAQHPCFNGGCASKNARIHLAVAPCCNISCNYCVREYDCANESRPGVTSTVLTPLEAFDRFKRSKELIPNLTTVGIAGPGDALAEWGKTRETIRLIMQYDSDMTFCLSTNGLLLPRYADEIADLGVTHVTVTVNAIDPSIGAKIYAYVKLDGITYEGEAAVGILLANQIEGIKKLVGLGVMVKVNTVLIAGVNDRHVEEISRFIADLGVSFNNIMQHIPVEGSVFGDLPQVSRHDLNRVRMQCSLSLPQMYHCQQCRADAIGLLGENLAHVVEGAETGRDVQSLKKNPSDSTHSGADESLHKAGIVLLSAKASADAVRIAVASKSGTMVDTHFGHTKTFMVYEIDGKTVRYLETRDTETYCAGIEDCEDDGKQSRLTRVITVIEDCSAVLCLRIGYAPSERLRSKGIVPIATCDSVSAAIEAARDVAIFSRHKSDIGLYKEVI